VSSTNEWDTELNTRGEKPYLRAPRYCSLYNNTNNRPFATRDHVVQHSPSCRASSLLFPHWDIKTKASQASLVQGLFVLMSQCGNNNELALQHGGFCTTWSLVAKGLLINVTFCLFYLNLKVEVRCFYWWDEISLALHTLLQLLLAAWDNPSWRAPIAFPLSGRGKGKRETLGTRLGCCFLWVLFHLSFAGNRLLAFYCFCAST